MTKNVLETISKLKCINLAKSVLYMRINNKFYKL